MKINVINDYRVEMDLGEEELSEFDITYESMDYGDVNTRRFLRELSQNARAVGIDADMSGRVLIEVFRISGGCRICFTFLPSENRASSSEKRLVKRDMSCLSFEKNDIELLCRFCRALGNSPESSLYLYGNKYYLFVTPFSGEGIAYSELCGEFGIRSMQNPTVMLSRCREFKGCLIESLAVQKLGNALEATGE